VHAKATYMSKDQDNNINALPKCFGAVVPNFFVDGVLLEAYQYSWHP